MLKVIVNQDRLIVKRDRKLGWDIRDSQARLEREKEDSNKKQETGIFKDERRWSERENNIKQASP